MCYAVLQIVTVLANMAQSSSCFNEIVDNDGLALLINFLNITPNSKLTEAELAACERVHQKSAIALTRLAKDPDNAARIVHKGLLLVCHLANIVYLYEVWILLCFINILVYFFVKAERQEIIIYHLSLRPAMSHDFTARATKTPFQNYGWE